MADIRRSVIEIFGEEVSTDEKLLAECVSLCQVYNMDPLSLKYKIEAMNYSSLATRSEISKITLDSISALKAQMQRDLLKPSVSRAKTKPHNTSAQVNRSRLPMGGLRNSNIPPAPVQVKTELTGETSVAGPSSSVVLKCSKLDVESKKSRSYRYMYEKISERSEALDRVIDDFGELIMEHYKIPELGDPSSSTDEEIVVIGRVVLDSESASSVRLSESTIELESSRMLSSGARVPIRFESPLKIRGNARGSNGIGIFPGAIIALKGKNGGGGYFLAAEVLTLPPLNPSPAATGTSSLKPEQNYGSSTTIYVACGPFTQDANLDYTPWKKLLQILNASKPNVVILIGPFMDSLHPKIKVGEIQLPLAKLFENHILGPLRTFLDSSPGSIAIIIPSVRDIISDHAVFPQAELEGNIFNFDPRIRLLPNPCTFSINDLVFATSSVDVLFHLRKEEFIKRGQEVDPAADETGSDAMANLCRHLLQQRSFYPIFPSPQELSHEVNLDISHSEGLKIVENSKNACAPDVLILPSRLKHFSKTVNTTMALNPSFLSKGTYGIITITAPIPSATLKERLNVEVVKLEE